MHRDLIVRTLVPFCLALAVLASPVAADDAAEQVFDLRFAGGTVDQYVAAIRKQVDTANIIVMSDAGRARVPAVELRGVSVATALSILHDTSQRTADEFFELAVEEHEPQYRTIGRSGQPGAPVRVAIGAPAFSIHARVQQFGRPPNSNNVTRVLAVSELLEAVKAEALLTAIETALQLIDDDMPPARIRFHEDTGLIIARGQPEQIASIEEVVDQVKDSARQRSQTRRRQASEAKALQDQLAQMQHDYNEFQRQAEDRFAAMEREKDQLHHVIRTLEIELSRYKDKDGKE